MTTLSLYRPPEPVGYWRISGNFVVSVQKRPCWLHRYFAAALLGWHWVDA
ncbi:hypothetical protein [uncultured Xanthomonas sp.]|nr:hypothetical protein [uncultured Xanthomonas sp.]